MSARPNVLIVEDDESVSLGCRQALQLAGYAVDWVDTAEAAFEKDRLRCLAAVVTDMRLPYADGLWLVRRCRELHPDLPVIMISGRSAASLAVEAIQSGAFGFLEKPFKPEALVDIVKRAIEERTRTQQAAAAAVSGYVGR